MPGHAGDQVVTAGVGQWNRETGLNWVQYYQTVIDGLGDGAVDGIAVHAYTEGAALAQVNTDYVDPSQDPHLLGGFRVYRDYLNATPHWARKLPVYITETDQDGAWNDTNNGWVKAVYAEINGWNAGADHQKIQAVALYRWSAGGPDTFNIYNLKALDQGGVKDDFRDATRAGYASPSPIQPAETLPADQHVPVHQRRRHVVRFAVLRARPARGSP